MPTSSVSAPAWLQRVLAVVLVTIAGPGPAVAQLPAPGPAVVALLRAEDARGAGPEGIRPITDGLRDPGLRPLAIRAIGRLERSDLTGLLLPYLSDDALREVTAEAIAQSLRGPVPALEATRLGPLVDSVRRTLAEYAEAESRAGVKGSLARSLARLPFAEAGQARAVEAVLVGLVAPDATPAEAVPAVLGVAHGLHTLARGRRTLGDPSPLATGWLRRAALAGGTDLVLAPVRRLAWQALIQANGADAATIRGAAGDRDPQVRRLVVAALPNVSDSGLHREVLARAADDPAPMVRVEWVRVFRQLRAGGGCGPLMAATGDPNPHVQLAAIDALGGPCPERDLVVALLRRLADSGPARSVPRSANQVSWHARAHALTALARTGAARARPLLERESRHPVWQVRMYVARGALALRDTAILARLAFDPVGSVREVAIQGLAATAGHLADRVFLRALESPDYHVVLAAARAIKGTLLPDSALPGVLTALERLSREGRQTSRDPRLELLARVDEIADARAVRWLLPLLSDADRAVADESRRIAERLAPGMVPAGTTPAPSVPGEPARGVIRVRVTMSGATGGGTFEFVMDGDRAPMTVSRVAALVTAGYYDGLSFHRVVPNFVVQGGSPGMNEYVGDGPFLRDELSLAHHARGTMGISTRGRDTGDAQWFINLVDNYRLDHDYTVFATIVAGMDVVDGILEGDVMESVRIVPGDAGRDGGWGTGKRE